MAETVVSFVSNHLATLLREEGSLLGGLRQEVQLIKDELGHMKAFLKVVEAKEDDDPRLQEWIKQVREAAYDIEDVLDEFVLRFAGYRHHGFCGSLQRILKAIKSLRARHQVASDIQSIKS
ncbi:putative disease resistance protein At1g50180 [Coffea eugenioides]|uniref:putative disease resistance protein At1g50180 n=1 Tax=Coffea eugenioides TaxID=49369 RepID=UPI000F615A90|nr:putative disease resistance protein At1g50180 [Coffea eugenioides]